MRRAVPSLLVWALGVGVLAAVGCKDRVPGTSAPGPAAAGPAPSAPPSAAGGVDDRFSASQRAYGQTGHWMTTPEAARLRSEQQGAGMRSGAPAAVDWQQARENAGAQQSRDAGAARARTGTPAATADRGRVQFVRPTGANGPEEAKDFPVPSKLKVEWKPDGPVTLQAYQGNKLVKEWAGVKSGAELDLPGAGETELKIWAGRDAPDHAVWVWVK